jgi:hypothetical protein
MKLSDAIEKGWRTVPKITDTFQVWDSQGDVIGACAIGAACYAVNPQAKVSDFTDARKFFPELYQPIEVFQDRELIFEGLLEDFITSLNDGGSVANLVPDTSEEGLVSYVRQLGY